MIQRRRESLSRESLSRESLSLSLNVNQVLEHQVFALRLEA